MPSSYDPYEAAGRVDRVCSDKWIRKHCSIEAVANGLKYARVCQHFDVEPVEGGRVLHVHSDSQLTASRALEIGWSCGAVE